MNRFTLWLSAVCLLPACGTTYDSLGYDDPRDAVADPRDAVADPRDAGADPRDAGADARVLHPLIGPASYPNAFGSVLGKTEGDITSKIAATFDSLFHGDPGTQAIYFPVGSESDQAYILDTLHGDVRTEGIGLAMIIAVELDKRDEFDRLWRYAKSALQYSSGPNRGYFHSRCDTSFATIDCVDPFGLEQFVMALLFANDRWRSDGTIDYATDVQSLLDVMRNKEMQNGGIVAGVTNSFDTATKLMFDMPNTIAATYTRPSIEMPAYYELWAQATGDSFWIEAAAAARGYWQRSANATTGLMPTRASFDGTPVSGSDTFEPEGYRTQINMVLDYVFWSKSPWEVTENSGLLDFFFQQGIDQYGEQYGLDGTLIIGVHDPSLVAVNGVSALIATNDQRGAFIGGAWNLPIPTGTPRYYSGLLDLVELLILSGRFRVY